MPDTLLIHTESIGPRLRYACRMAFTVLSEVDHTITNNWEEFEVYSGPKFHYGVEKDCAFLFASGLLEGVNVEELDPGQGEYRQFPVIFTQKKAGLLPFDVLSAVFYAVSRYEEYLPFDGDKLGRFGPTISFAHRLGILQKLYVHRWVSFMLYALNDEFNTSFHLRKESTVEASFDIDNAFAYRHKGFARTAGALVRSIAKGREFVERLAVLRGKRSDPYDNYAFLEDTCSKAGIRPKIFVLCASRARYDKNISPDSSTFKNLVTGLDTWAEVGIHPSVASNRFGNMSSEKDQLRSILGREVTLSRQHFLVLRFPGTYRNLINLDIGADHSMGYSSIPGFRAGISWPHTFFDLEKNEESGLIIHPFSFMDATFIHHSPGLSATEVLKSQWVEVKEFGGILHTVWHNEYFGGDLGPVWQKQLKFLFSELK